MTTGFKEDVFSLDEGSVVLQWPERLSKISAQDLEDWLALIGRKIKRAADAPPPGDADEPATPAEIDRPSPKCVESPLTLTRLSLNGVCDAARTALRRCPRNAQEPD